MAKQKSIIKLEGTIGDISFYKSKDGYIAREYSPISAERMATDPAFKRTRENGAEFGRAGKAGRLLRKALRELIQIGSDRRMANRLTKEMVKVLQADQVSVRGERNVLDGELELLRGFNFNITAPLDSVLFADFSAVIDRPSGVCSVNVPVFNPEKSLRAPAGTTHFEFECFATAIDFEQEIIETERTKSGYLSSSSVLAAAISLQMNLSANSTHPIFIGLSILFYQEINGVYYPLNNGSNNASQLVEIKGL